MNGDPARLIQVLLKGPEAVLPRTQESANQMPAFPQLSDEETAAVLSYVRLTYGKDAGAITPGQVEAERSKL